MSVCEVLAVLSTGGPTLYICVFDNRQFVVPLESNILFSFLGCFHAIDFFL